MDIRKLPKWGVGCVPLSDEWWKCLTQEVGQETQLDEAKSLVSRQWGLRFQQGAVTNHVTCLPRMTPPDAHSQWGPPETPPNQNDAAGQRPCDATKLACSHTPSALGRFGTARAQRQ